MAWGDSLDAPAARAQLQADFPGVQYYEHAGRLSTIYAAPFSIADTPELSAAVFVQDYSRVLGVSADELAPGLAFRDLYTLPTMYQPETDSYKFTLVYYHQHRDGIPVFRGELRLLVRNEDGFPLVLAQSDVRPLGDFVVPAGFDGFMAEGAAHAAAMAEVPGLINFSPAELVIWAGVDDMDAAPAVALTFTADSGEGSDPYDNWLFVCDATTGAVLYQESLVYHVDIVGSVSGLCTPDYRADACATEVWTPLPYLRVTGPAGQTYTDINGNFVLANPGTTPVDVTSTLTGQWFYIVNSGTGGNASITLNVTPPGPANFQHNQSNAEHQTAEVNAYLQANTVRDMILGAKPNYPTIQNQPSMKVTVNINSTCNAYYSASTINFYRSGGGCNNTGFGDVVHHEYGHNTIEKGGSGQGAYGEGMSDSLAMLITGRSAMALGFQDCNTPIRNADNNCKYLASGCSTCGSAIHTCGQLLSGCIWDTWKELKITEPVNHLEIIRRLTVESILLHGSVTTITPAITVHFLTLDDNDGNIYNGTPHYYEIATGFGKHDMPAPALSLLGFDYPSGKPEFISPTGGTTVRVEVTPIAGEPQPSTGTLYYNVGAGWVNVPMTEVSPNVYDAVMPAATCGTKVQYYFSAKTTTNQTMTDPSNAPTTTYSALAGYGWHVVYENNFDTNPGWTISGGTWAFGQPTGQGGATYGYPDPTSGYTGTNVYGYNLNGDYTNSMPEYHLTSTAIDCTGAVGTTLRFWRRLNVQGSASDHAYVRISTNGTTWTNLWSNPSTAVTENAWSLQQHDISAYANNQPTVYLRWTMGTTNSSRTYSGWNIDDVSVMAVQCNPPFAKGDLNCDGNVDFGDINPFVLALTNPAGYAAAFPNCNIMLGDINDDGLVNFGDINPFVRLLTNP
ncbi:MAG: choice-of-anchor J domain-containing protein [Planctomycetota bacterium]